MAVMGRKTETWGSKFGFIMAAVGSSVGLGNFWRFPFTAGENGGAAFIIIYLLCVLLFGLPILMAEYGIGRKSGRSAIDGVSSLASAENKSSNWTAIGWIGSLAAFFILTFYMVISGWILASIPQAFSGVYSGYEAEAARLTAEALAADPNAAAVTLGDVSGANFGATISNRGYMLLMLGLFIAANVFVVSRGVKGGIERAAVILMPLFFLMLIGMVVFAMTNGNAAAATKFLLQPDFSKVDFFTFLAAIGQAFFSIGVGSCLMITYGSYLSDDTNIPRSSGIVAGADTLVAIIAGFAIFPLVFQFAYSLEDFEANKDLLQGAKLFFIALPTAFSQMPGGDFIGGAFFSLALFAALTSSISLMEVGVSWLEDREGVTRPGAAIGVGFVLFMIGAGYIYNDALIDFTDFITGSLMLPLGGILVAIFSGWILSRDTFTSEFGDGQVMKIWHFAVRWIVPPAVTLILVMGVLIKLNADYGLPLPTFLIDNG